MKLKARSLTFLVSLLAFCSANAQDPNGMLFDQLAEYFERTEICGTYEAVPESACVTLLDATAKKAMGLPVDSDELKETVETAFNDPKYLNAVLPKIIDPEEVTWLNLEFKSLDSENGDTVLGLGVDIDWEFHSNPRKETKNWSTQRHYTFKSSGNITGEKIENPRDFFRSNLSAFHSYTTNIPTQPDDFADALTDAAVSAALACDNDGASEECQTARKIGDDLLDSTMSFLSSFSRYEVGFDLGYETDQSWDFDQTTFGLYGFAQREDWGAQSLFGRFNITPAVRLAVDRVAPDDESPRAVAGDDSDYYRFSGALTLWIPLPGFFGENLTLTGSYRHYRELDAADIVKGASLETHNMRTIALTSPTGLFVSYSSGKLPFDLKEDNVVELGWKWHK
jgi:hypothetical protein